MADLVECVPNFSEGRRPEVVDEIVRAVDGVAGVQVLDHTHDEAHNRSVVTFAGPPDPVTTAAGAALGTALELIDMRRQRGVHPRIGAADVVPFVPLQSTTMEACVELARRFAADIAARFDLPVYLYGEAALRPERRRLANVRRGEYELLRERIAFDPDSAPDFGPARLHLTAGATAVGARRPLIAFNVNLRTGDVAVARRIARAIRESSGGLPAVQAMGVGVTTPGGAPVAQVSTNLVDWQRTGIPAVVHEVRRLALAAGTDLDHCELIGLAPAEALAQVDADELGVPDFASGRSIEERLTATA